MGGKKKKSKGKKGKKKFPGEKGAQRLGAGVLSAPRLPSEGPVPIKVKRKCCRSDPRCKRCPVVYHRLLKSGALELEGKALKQAWKEARRW